MRWRGLAALRASGDPLSQSLARVFDATAKQRTVPEERAWIERIERLREELATTPATLEARLSEYTAKEADERTIRVHTMENLARQKAPPRIWGLLLFRLVRELRPATCLELGTGLGISAAYQAAAFRLNGRGRLVTVEAAESRVALAERNLVALGLGDVDIRLGRFDEVLAGILEELGPVDLALVDGHHAERPTLQYFERITGHLSPTAVLIFDDITWSAGMTRAWRRIRSDARVTVSVDLGRMGLCLCSAEARPGGYSVPLA